jgi:16S rRNA (adenine1518-N6/adenine1519-N6)-dimethyltransferase
MVSLGQTLVELGELGIRPSKRLGQNFLVDGNVVSKLVTMSGVENSDSVVEIGPGLGVISEGILSTGAMLYAVEVDRRLCGFLRKKFSNCAKFSLLRGDAVKFPVAELPKEITDFKVVANLPYAISSPWIDALLTCENIPLRMDLIVQLDTALRFFATTDRSEICPISIFLQSAYSAVGMRKISSESFFPKPAVSSVVISVKRKSDAFCFKCATKFAIRKIFTNRRKQVGRIARESCPELAAWIDENSMPITIRPEEIPIPQWRSLDKFF